MVYLKMTGKLQLVILLMVISFSAFAQSHPLSNGNLDAGYTSTTTPDISNSNKGVLSFGGGIGYSTIDWRLYGVLPNGGSSAYEVSQTPAYNIYADYGTDTKTCVGLGFTYQSVTGVPTDRQTGCLEYLTRYNFGLRIIRYTSKDIASSFYYGVRMGISFWTDNFNVSQLNGEQLLGSSNPNYTSIQIFIGYRFLISNNIAFSIEGGIGTPYLIEAGLSFRI